MPASRCQALRTALIPLFAILSFPSCLAPARAQGVSGDHVPQELLVKFKPGVTPGIMGQIHSGVGGQVIKGFRGRPLLFHVRIPPAVNLDEAISYYQFQADVEYVEKNFIYRIDETMPNDPSFAQQYAWKNTGQTGGTSGADVRATLAWDKTRGNSNVVVAVIDTGVDYLHQDLQLNMWTNPGEANLCSNGVDDDGNGFVDDCRGWNFVSDNNDPRDDHNHGSHVAGTIGARTDNGMGVAGANWAVQIMPIKAFNSSGAGTLADIIPAIDYATANGAMMSNNSWGGGGYSQALKDAIDRANAAGVLFITVAGNSNSDNDTTLFYPCSYDSSNVICVAATDQNDAKASFSSYGATKVDLGAPGVGILSTVRGNSYASYSGTSMAAPHVTGGAALVKGCKVTLGHLTIKDVLLQTARPVASLAGKAVSGGVVDYAAAIYDFRVGTCDGATEDPLQNLLPVSNPGGPYSGRSGQLVQFDGSGSFDSDGQILVYSWNFGDGTTGDGVQPVHAYSTAGTYTVTLTVRDNLGATDTQGTTATVQDAPKKRGRNWKGG